MQNFLKAGREAIRLASKVIKSYSLSSLNVEWKSDNTPVTLADQKAEAVMREFFLKETPSFGLIGEEHGLHNPDSEYQWVMDPIDGTKSFIHGVPLYGTLLGLLYKGQSIAGFINITASDQLLEAALGQGAFLQGQRVQCSNLNSLADSLVLSGTVNTLENKGYGEAFKNLRHSARLYRGWGDCYGYFLVATGRAEVMVDPVVSLWDVAPLPVLLREAGGFFSDIKGSQSDFDLKNTPHYEGYSGLACAPGVFQQTLKILS
jgi:myo-inositol-1(or 4)-monophosphatase